MKYILPLPSISDENRLMLRNIYDSCSRTNVYTDANRIKITTHFIDNTIDYNKIIEKIVIPVGLDPIDINNMWNSKDPTYNCSGINFNVLQGDDFLNIHKDYNPTKLNILISGCTANMIRYVEDEANECYDWSTPALIDVRPLHYVDNIETNVVPRVMMQIFLTNPFEYYKNKINLNPLW